MKRIWKWLLAGLATALHLAASRRGPPLPQKQGRNGFTPSWRFAQQGFTLDRRSAQQGFTLDRRSAQQGFTLDRRSAQQGFTLVELMVVILIIGLLATVVIINVLPATDKAAETKARADVSTLETAVEMYRLNKLTFPSASEGLQALAREGYVKRLPKDPWGNPYHYAAPGRDGRPFDVYSYGADGREGGEGKDADIGNWDG